MSMSGHKTPGSPKDEKIYEIPDLPNLEQMRDLARSADGNLTEARKDIQASAIFVQKALADVQALIEALNQYLDRMDKR